MIERFLNKTVIAGNCLVWTGAKTPKGYGRFLLNKRNWLAHRVSYMIHYGKDPGEKLVCHTCDNTSCVKPEHLFLGTQSDNMKDSANKKRHRCSKVTECPQGHPYSKDNTGIYDGYRHCRACYRIRSQRRRDALG